MASEVITFTSSEAMAVTWLNGKLGSGVGVATKVPDPRPEKLVKVTATGAHRLDLAYREAQLTFECWATEETDAEDIAELVHAHMKAAEGETINGAFVRRVNTVGGPVNSPDPESQTARYLVTVGVQYRGAALPD
jgi:hypothetical protein